MAITTTIEETETHNEQNCAGPSKPWHVVVDATIALEITSNRFSRRSCVRSGDNEMETCTRRFSNLTVSCYGRLPAPETMRRSSSWFDDTRGWCFVCVGRF